MTRPLPSNGAPARRFLAPLERFLHIEAASGLVLLAAAAAAMLWANSPWAAGYEHFWHAPLAVGLGGFVFSEPLHFWVNDGLMTIFFLVVGLEIRRELHEGALANAKLAALPLAAALGGILVPAALYLAFTRGHAQLDQGWAVPTATDIAFAVGVLALLGRRVPAALRVLLLALAIVDDIAAILVIAFFYVDGIGAGGLLIAAGGMVLILVFQRLGLRTAWPYVVPSAIVWFGVLRAGVHPAIAGVIAGLLTPVTNAFARENPLAAAARALEDFRERALHGTRDAGQLLPPLRALKDAQLDMLPPVVRVQAALHPWVAYGVMPLFALANAGVNLDGLSLSHAGSAALTLGVTTGLVLGKPLGILAFTAVAVRVGLCALPEGVTWRGIGLIGCLGGIGFTMSIFIANLAFPDATLLTMAKFAVLIASAAAGILGLIAGRLLTPLPLNQPTAAAERSP